MHPNRPTPHALVRGSTAHPNKVYKGVTYCGACGGPDCPLVSSEPAFSKCPAHSRTAGSDGAGECSGSASPTGHRTLSPASQGEAGAEGPTERQLAEGTSRRASGGIVVQSDSLSARVEASRSIVAVIAARSELSCLAAEVFECPEGHGSLDASGCCYTCVGGQ